MKLFVRVYAACGDAQAADALMALMRAALSHLEVVISIAPKPYWKVVEYVEFTFIALHADQASLHGITALCADGWVHAGEPHARSSIWNKVGDASFVDPCIQWASVDLDE